MQQILLMALGKNTCNHVEANMFFVLVYVVHVYLRHQVCIISVVV